VTGITNEDDLSFRQAVKGVPFHLRVHFHLGTLPNHKVSIDADGQSLIGALTSLEPECLGGSPRGCRQDLCAMRESSNLPREHCKRLGYFVCQDEAYLQSSRRRPSSDASQAVGAGRYNSGSLP
jgi:hypothetical protein